jgi:hypothetical protein
LQVQHTYTQFHPPSPRPPLQQWLQLLLDGSGKLALMDRMLQASKLAVNGGWVPGLLAWQQ